MTRQGSRRSGSGSGISAPACPKGTRRRAKPPGERRNGRARGAALPAGLCLILVLILALAVPALLPSEAQALRCPAGWNTRGINCCRVSGGRVHCSRNPNLPSALAPLMARPQFVAPMRPIDNSDLAPGAAEADPAYGPRPVTADQRLLDPADDVCDDTACDFDTIRALAEDNRGSGQCIARLRTHACRHSMWRDLDIPERLARILVLGAEFADEYDLDVRVFPCIAAIETRTLEPLTVSELNCTADTSDQGLPQIIRSTFRWLHDRLGFESRVVADADGARRFSRVGRSVRYQLELMAAVLAHSGLNPSRSNYLNALINYNGGTYSIAYGTRVDACLQCLRQRIDVEDFTIRGDPIRCLNAAVGPGADIEADLAAIRALCE